MNWLQDWHDQEGTELILGDLSLLPQSYLEVPEIAKSRNREKAAVQRILEEKFPEKKLIKDAFGKPYFSDHSMHMNYSHSPLFIFWGSHPERPIGVDVESTRETLRKVAPKFCNASEWEFSENGTHLDRLVLLWSAKESLFKAYGKGEIDFKQQLFILPETLQRVGSVKAQVCLENTYECVVHYTYINGGICTWTLWPNVEQKAV